MKPIAFKIPITNKELLRFQIDDESYLYDKLHLHPELQIGLILKSEGTVIAGDYIGRFVPGDIFVIGSNLPHVFKNDSKYFQDRKDLRVYAFTIYPNEKLLNEGLLSYKETASLKKILQDATKGMKVEGETKKSITEKIWKLKRSTGMNRLMMLLEILKTLSESKEIKILNKHLSPISYSEKEGKRMIDIFQFTFEQSHRAISVDEVAAIANMSIPSFCRYFKLHTRKTYIEFLNEIRINNAYMLLQQEDSGIADVCYRVGFNNLSNFNRIFKKITGHTPREFKNAT
ncbi:MAG: helix-turn-helix transcriptional regulator [Bacteroidetes bacterium]|nr:helix-turn-helix transcriptional regulator [Bacteroidota bacterium]